MAVNGCQCVKAHSVAIISTVITHCKWILVNQSTLELDVIDAQSGCQIKVGCWLSSQQNFVKWYPQWYIHSPRFESSSGSSYSSEKWQVFTVEFLGRSWPLTIPGPSHRKSKTQVGLQWSHIKAEIASAWTHVQFQEWLPRHGFPRRKCPKMNWTQTEDLSWPISDNEGIIYCKV